MAQVHASLGRPEEAVAARLRGLLEARCLRRKDGLAFMDCGQAYEINNQKVHSVMNKGDVDRINFIFDYLPPARSADSGRAPARSP